MHELSLAHKKHLKRLAHDIKPLVQIGQKGVTETLIEAVLQAIIAHELIKIKFLDFKDEKLVLINEIVEKTQSNLVAIIGHVAILYKQNPEKESLIKF